MGASVEQAKASDSSAGGGTPDVPTSVLLASVIGRTVSGSAWAIAAGVVGVVAGPEMVASLAGQSTDLGVDVSIGPELSWLLGALGVLSVYSVLATVALARGRKTIGQLNAALTSARGHGGRTR